MKLDEIIEVEFKLYLKRYKAWNDSDQLDETAEMMTVESERILKQLYRLKHNDEPTDNVIGWAVFMGGLGKQFSE